MIDEQAPEADPQFDWVSELPRVIVVTVQCPACGYEPLEERPLPTQCPKCLAGRWERFVRRGKINDPTGMAAEELSDAAHIADLISERSARPDQASKAAIGAGSSRRISASR